MKKFISALLLASTMSSAFASNCGEFYESRANARSTAQMIGLSTIAVGSFFTGTVPLFLIGASAGLGASAIVKKGQLTNEFDVIAEALDASKYNDLSNKSLIKVAKKVNKIGDRKFELKMDTATISKIIREADVRMDFCPVVRVKRNGEEKRAVMNLSGFSKLIAALAASGNTDVKITNLNEVE